jgi:hypothetical protein
VPEFRVPGTDTRVAHRPDEPIGNIPTNQADLVGAVRDPSGTAGANATVKRPDGTERRGEDLANEGKNRAQDAARDAASRAEAEGRDVADKTNGVPQTDEEKEVGKRSLMDKMRGYRVGRLGSRSQSRPRKEELDRQQRRRSTSTSSPAPNMGEFGGDAPESEHGQGERQHSPRRKLTVRRVLDTAQRVVFLERSSSSFDGTDRAEHDTLPGPFAPEVLRLGAVRRRFQGTAALDEVEADRPEPDPVVAEPKPEADLAEVAETVSKAHPPRGRFDPRRVVVRPPCHDLLVLCSGSLYAIDPTLTYLWYFFRTRLLTAFRMSARTRPAISVTAPNASLLRNTSQRNAATSSSTAPRRCDLMFNMIEYITHILFR